MEHQESPTDTKTRPDQTVNHPPYATAPDGVSVHFEGNAHIVLFLRIFHKFQMRTNNYFFNLRIILRKKLVVCV